MQWMARAYALWHLAFLSGVVYLLQARDYAAFELAGIVLTTGLVGGAGFNVAHELCHRRSAMDRGLALALLCALAYPNFFTEHRFHHHRWVASPRDPGSAPRGRSLYRHLLTAIPRNIANGFLARKPNQSVQHAVLFSATLWLCTGLLYGAVAVLAGMSNLAVMLAAHLVAIVWLETANYFQHYGLRRATLPSGRLEPVSDAHSWDVRQPLMNKVWGNLPLHADHHARPGRLFNQLRFRPAAQCYPFGYIACTALALFPRRWDALVEQLLTPTDDKESR